MQNREVMGTEISVDMTVTRRFCLETVTKLTDSRGLNGIPDTISGAFRFRLGTDIFKQMSDARQGGGRENLLLAKLKHRDHALRPRIGKFKTESNACTTLYARLGGGSAFKPQDQRNPRLTMSGG